MPRIRKAAAVRVYKLKTLKTNKRHLLKKKSVCRKLEKRAIFCDVVSNVLKMSEKTGYDPATGTNWCHMPMEIRMKCIESMNFRTRACLRGTSTTEKALVESKKYYVDLLLIDWNHFVFDSHYECMEEEDTVRNKRDTRKEARKMALQLRLILKLCEFYRIFVRFNNILEQEDFVEDFPILCYDLEIGDVNTETALFFVKNCVEGIDTVDFRPALNLPMYQIINSRSVYTARSVSFAELECCCYLHELIEIWGIIDAEVGTSLYTESRKGIVFKPLIAHFGYRDIDKNVLSVRVPIGDSGKEVIIKRREYCGDWETVTCKIVEPEP